MDKKQDYLNKIDKIPTVSFNKEQKIIAKKILENTNEKDLDSVYGLITQRVKTGFVFDEAPEVNHNAVALIKENEKLRIDSNFLDCIEHKLIIGENYDALKNLCATYIDKNGKGLIDLIYIDPPYNTEATKKEGNDYKEEIEATKFVYRDKFTRDGWLNMINERLKLAKRLLSDTGVIFISIDDTEQAYLKILCDEIFGEENFIATFIIDKTAQGANQSNTFKTQHEYLLMYKKLYGDEINCEIEQINNDKFKYRDKKGAYAITNSFDSINSPLVSNKNRGYTVYYNEKTGEAIVKDEYDREKNIFNAVDEKLIKEGYTPIRPGIRNGVQYPWNWMKERFINEYKDELVFQKNRKGELAIYHKNRSEGMVKDTTLKKFDTRQDGNKCLLDIMNSKCFDYPKSINMMKWVFTKIKNKNSVILDFFAGSGTTGQAVMELNEEDGGHRKFILVTNNENNIGEKITYERLYRVIKGKGTKGETFAWSYSEDNPYLSKNSVRVFNIETTELTLNDLDKAENLKEIAKNEFKKLNDNYFVGSDFDIYNELSALNPYKAKEDEK